MENQQLYPCRHDPMCSNTDQHLEKVGRKELINNDDTSDPICDCGYPGFSCCCDDGEGFWRE